MLVTVRRLVKNPSIFEFVRKENDFYLKLLNYCREGLNYQVDFNLEAWNLLYQIIHRQFGTMEQMTKHNLLTPFLELVGTSSTNVIIINGLNCISKLFCMLATEQKKARRKDIKTVEKDLKSLNAVFIERSLFIKIHMIYKKFIGQCPGAAFYALANFYNVLQVSPGCHKLMKDIHKKAEYKDGLTNISGMFSPTATVAEQDTASTGTFKDIKKMPKKAGFTLSRASTMRP